MLKRIPGVLLVAVLVLLCVQCAKKGMPEGGPEDEEPPTFLRANPENYNTNFTAEEIRIFFDEYIKLEDARQQIVISPPIEPRPSIIPMGTARKDIRIQNLDSLQKNTTYTINFGKSIVDNNEGNPLPYFKYVFSTGDYLDSLEISGTIKDAYLKAPSEFISIFLYEVDSTFSDSLVFKETPRYITYTLDSTVNFEMENLKEGTYQILAVEDKNDNYNFDPKSEKIGFIKDYITLPTDSTYKITIFKEKLPFEAQRPKLLKGNQILFGYEGSKGIDSVEINLLTPKPEGFQSRIVKDAKTDTLYYWYNIRPENDSLSFEVLSPSGRDTLFTKIGEEPRDSLNVTTEPSGGIEFEQNFKFKANTPITDINSELISIRDKDSVLIPFNAEMRPLENEIIISFEKSESTDYLVTALPGAITDLFKTTNDTIQQSLNTKSYADYGSIILNLQNVDRYPILVQLTNEKGEVMAEKYSNGDSNFHFRFLNPAEYLIRVIFDENENQKWDTGDYLKRIQPEEIQYYQDTINVRSNWDMPETFILE
ncbi:Ig-like domain-containing protein [Salegentibacter sp. 24]|uniref:Ig-like domain-containing protein n=1 Tax=Salegentibacter sp. 24 TaxID=2183986 RepID=UPI00105C261A|nr:Ig-like domain-containing protein [Salegentibacter sp. 24]TDN95500.1 Ig-like domain-containing protein [Salegentibacter sp. 24]